MLVKRELLNCGFGLVNDGWRVINDGVDTQKKYFC